MSFSAIFYIFPSVASLSQYDQSLQECNQLGIPQRIEEHQNGLHILYNDLGLFRIFLPPGKWQYWGKPVRTHRSLYIHLLFLMPWVAFIQICPPQSFPTETPHVRNVQKWLFSDR